jgi:16S rRNA (guanine(966)-N(2))-methyltransferase RsmD
VRQAVFSALFDKTEYAHALDIFAGTGSFGIEALSRGAEHVTFIDTRTELIKKNLEGIDRKHWKVLKGDAMKETERLSDCYDIIFLDPPYGLYPMEDMLKHLSEKQLLANDGILIYEESVRAPFPASQEYFRLLKEKRYGETVIYYMEAI